jgi:hypothetical protein
VEEGLIMQSFAHRAQEFEAINPQKHRFSEGNSVAPHKPTSLVYTASFALAPTVIAIGFSSNKRATMAESRYARTRTMVPARK